MKVIALENGKGWYAMKWTVESVAAVNWKEKSALETLDACVEHHQEQMGTGAWLYADTCPACQKWSEPDSIGRHGTYGNCGDCPLQPFCCDGLWQKWQGASLVQCNGVSEREVFQCAMLNFIIHKRDEERARERLLAIANAKAKCKSEPEYEWVDCTLEFFPKAKIMGSYWYCVFGDPWDQSRVYLIPMVNAGYDKNKIRIVKDCLYFRIERRVEKKPEKKREFKVGDAVLHNGGRKIIVEIIDGMARLEGGYSSFAHLCDLQLIEAAK